MASPSGFTPSPLPPVIVPPITPFSDPAAFRTSNIRPTPTLTTPTLYTTSVLNYGPMLSGGTLSALGAASQTLSATPPNSSWGEPGVGDNLTASPVYLFIFAIALGALIILSLTIVIRSLILRQRLIALHGPDWRRQYGANILEMLGLPSRRMWAGTSTQHIPQPARRRRRDHGQKPVLVDVYISEGKCGGYWEDVQPYSTSLRPNAINPSVKTNVLSLLSLRAKEYQPPPPRSSARVRPGTLTARVQPTQPPLSPLSRLHFSATVPPPPTSFKPVLDEKNTPSRSSSVSSIRDLKAVEHPIQPLPGLEVDVCLLVRMPNSDSPSYRPRAHKSVSQERRRPSRTHLSSPEEVVDGGLMIACAHGVQLYGVPEGPPPAPTGIPENIDLRRGVRR